MGRLLISAAHTLENPGAVYQNLREADLTRKLLQQCLPHLEELNIEFQAVPLDLPLLQRIEWINNTGYSEENGDIFVEIHINDGGKRGIEAWFSGSAAVDNNSQKLSEELLDYVCKKTGYQSQGAKSEYDHELTSLIILNQTNPAATAIECLYMDNPEDIAILEDETKMDELAKTLSEGIAEFLKKPMAKPKPKPAASLPSDDISNSFDDMDFSAPAPLPFTPSTPSLGGLGSATKPKSPSTGGSKATLMDREQRKEMIKKVSLKILGKEPKANDMNYYLNIGISEEDLTKKLLDSEDFVTMVKNAGEFKEMKDKVQKLEAEIDQLKSSSNDNKDLQVSLNRLLEQKNLMIAQMKQELVNQRVIAEGQSLESRKKMNLAETHPPKIFVKKTLKDRFLDAFIRLTKI
jgi:hypothetical protein